MDSDDDQDDALNKHLTGFLFGNVDENGKLESDVLDEQAKSQLNSLSKFGLYNLIGTGFISENESNSNSDSSDSDNNRMYKKKNRSDGNDATDYKIKEDSAEDFFDINELADDAPLIESKDIKDDYDIEDEIPAIKVNTDGSNSTQIVSSSSEKNEESTDDKELMPPPPKNLQLALVKVEDSETTAIDSKKIDKKLETPLGAMLPSKYAEIDVTELFPDFRQDSVLRFSRLFGPGKFSSLPQIWRSVGRRAKKKRREREKKDSESTSDSDEPRKVHGFDLKYAPVPIKEMVISDDEDKLLSEMANDDKEEKPEDSTNGDNKTKVADWRFGPAQVWYDMLDVPDTGEGFNYGFKMKDKSQEEVLEEVADVIPDDAFLMVSQLHWEDDVVWDGNAIKDKVEQKLNSKTNAAGWLPSSGSRTAGAFSQPGKSAPPTTSKEGQAPKQSMVGKFTKAQIDKMINKQHEEPDDTWYSIFPVENEELVYSKWEEEVIWDSEAMTRIPKPKVLTLDPNDENIILGIPDDIDPAKIHRNTGPQPKVKIPHPHVKKSKILLGKAGVINVLAEDTPPPPPKSPDRDPFNISNDVFYAAKTMEATMGIKVTANLIQHSTPVVELRAPFVPTHMGPMKLRMFHRPHMKNYSYGALASTSAQSVAPLLKHIKKKAAQRETERIASGGGEIFFMRSPEDLTGRDGELILIEFCEENPPLMNQVGMCSKLKNYYKRNAGKMKAQNAFRYGETVHAHTSPFLGIINPGQCIQVVENSMYRAPIYEHNIPPSDFLVIRTRNNYYIREADALFTAGQECPLYEVPGPNSKRANNFVRDFLQVFIYRLFWKSRDNPRKIRMDDIKTAFPAHSESSIRKRLKQCADFKRTGMDSNYWVIKPDFRLPSEEEIRAMVSPEQCCAYFSMIAAEQRLKDAGYGEKFIFAQQEDDDEEMQLKMDDEVKVAPWNTTRAYIQAMRGKCILQLNGPADPTGCGEGFSYVRMPNKPTQNKEEQESQPKRTVTGTDADLRRLSLNNAKALLRKYGVPEEEIKKLSRWEVIDVVRTLSTEKAKAGEEGMDKFSRGNRFSIAEHQERYKEECQRIFNLQNRVLASSEVLSTDEGESTEEDEESDLEELGKNLENMLANKKTSVQVLQEREEQERQELLKLIEGRDNPKSAAAKKKEEDLQQSQMSTSTKILKITRTFKNAEGREYTRVETVRRSAVIDAYVKIRTTKDEAFIKQFATLDEAQKEEMKRERRRIQEQLRRIKRNQEKIGKQNDPHHVPGSTPISLGDRQTSMSQHSSSSFSKDPNGSKESSPNKKKIKLKPDLKLKCGACGQVGHMRTNKACPQYTGMIPQPAVNVAMTEEQEEEIEKDMFEHIDDEELVNVDGTKVKLSGKLIKRHEDVRRRALLLKVPKDAFGKGKRRRMGMDEHCDYLAYHKTTNRARTDPIVVLCSILEEILNELRDLPDVAIFMFPVNAKKVPDYPRIIQSPMDMQTMREKLRQRKYHSREEFLADVNQIVENSSLYNGPTNNLTMSAKRLLQKCVERIGSKEDKLMLLEKAINPLLGDDDQAALSFIFEKFLNTELKARQESWPFLKPVNKKQVKDYYTIIHRPMDLETVTKKVSAHKYHARSDFLADIQLIANNCEKFNGIDASFTKQAKVLVDFTKQALDGLDISHLEDNIAQVKERVRSELVMNWGEDESFGDFSSRPQSPDNDFVDIEAGHSPRAGPSVVAAHPEVKRSRGRPRKNQSGEGGISKYMKKKIKPIEEIIDVCGGGDYDHLKQDLQFSSDDDDTFENPFDNVTAVDESQLSVQDQSAMSIGTGHGEDDSQQAAEAMVQLGSMVGFYPQQQQQQPEDLDFDPNYDPSDFLMKKEPISIDQQEEQEQYQENESFDYNSSVQEMTGSGDQELQQNQNYYQPSTFNQSFSSTEFDMQQNQQQEEIASQSQLPPSGGDFEDLDVSDSDEEDQKMDIEIDNTVATETSTKDEEPWF